MLASPASRHMFDENSQIYDTKIILSIILKIDASIFIKPKTELIVSTIDLRYEKINRNEKTPKIIERVMANSFLCGFIRA